MAAVDIAYLTEFDSLWSDDAKSAILNSETLLFQNVAAYQACIADCMSCSAGLLASDYAFWCAECQDTVIRIKKRNNNFIKKM
ncbi:conjugative transfer protein [Orientia tsutsugamushi]|nr:conjugative transfer protein [Orientia tsutsugamushi]